jgi:hypothetical protein
MAYDKVIDSIKFDEALTYTANRIRVKTDSTDLITWDVSKGFGDAIDSITSQDLLNFVQSLGHFQVTSANTATNLTLNIPNVTTLNKAFDIGSQANNLKKIELTVSEKLTNMSYVFNNRAGGSLEEIIFYGDLSKVTTLNAAFACGGTGLNDNLKKILGLDFTSVTTASQLFNSQRGLVELDIRANTVGVALDLGEQRNLNLSSCINVLNALKDLTGGTALTVKVHDNLKNADTGVFYTNYVKLDATTNLYISCDSTDVGAVTIATAITNKNWTIA